MNAGYGLTVRWSLAEAPAGVEETLREYVVGTSIARFMFLDGLAFKVWRMRPAEWFEGTYVFDTEHDRTMFRADFESTMADAKGTEIIGSLPMLIESYEVVAIAEGPSGFRRGAGPGTTDA
jgi:hypothetical protein